MVERSKCSERPFGNWKCVVESAGSVEEHQGGAVDGKGRQLGWAVRKPKQQNRARTCEQETNEMRGAVEWLANPHSGIYPRLPSFPPST